MSFEQILFWILGGCWMIGFLVLIVPWVQCEIKYCLNKRNEKKSN
jgi:hypothetical protein